MFCFKVTCNPYESYVDITEGNVIDTQCACDLIQNKPGQ